MIKNRKNGLNKDTVQHSWGTVQQKTQRGYRSSSFFMLLIEVNWGGFPSFYDVVNKVPEMENDISQLFHLTQNLKKHIVQMFHGITNSKWGSIIFAPGHHFLFSRQFSLFYLGSSSGLWIFFGYSALLWSQLLFRLFLGHFNSFLFAWNIIFLNSDFWLRIMNSRIMLGRFCSGWRSGPLFLSPTPTFLFPFGFQS